MHPIAQSPLTQLSPKRITVLGSTGSIGRNTLDIISQHASLFEIEALTAQDNVALLIEQALTFRPKLAVIGNESYFSQLKAALSGTRIEVAAGEAAIREAAQRPSDWVMAAIVGAAGLLPLMAAIERGATIAFASKECLVCAGSLMMQACKQYGATLLPVDSEHNAIFQVLDFSQMAMVEKITLTASGGPFRTRPLASLTSITPEEATTHPNWNMGAKISVDSATMMNKGLEMIEAHHLFGLPSEQIDVIIHPESIIHSLVHYRDGSVLAQLGMPDMRVPITYTLAWPNRLNVDTPRLDLATLGSMHFQAPDIERFPALGLARDAMNRGASTAIAFNAANEVAVARFLRHEIKFLQITQIVASIMAKYEHQTISNIEDVLSCDRDVRMMAQEILG